MANDELKVGGFSVGGRDLMDPELTGSNVRDRATGRFTDKAPVSRIADAIRTGSSAQTGAGKTGAAVSSKAAAVMMQNMQPIMKQLQTLTEERPEFAEEIQKLMDLFKESHKYNAKEFSEKSVEIIKQIERIKMSAGNDEQAQQIAAQLTAGIGEEVKSERSFGGIKGKVREAFNVDKDAGFKEQFKQAFSMERMFGGKGGFGAAEAQARGDYEREQQAKAIELATGDQGIGVAGGGVAPAKGTAKASGGVFGKSGIDRESFAEQQTEVLKDILSVLEEIRDGGGMGGGEEGGGPPGLLPRLPRGPGGRITGPKKPSLMQRMKAKVGLGPKPAGTMVKAPTAAAGAIDDVARAGATVADDAAKLGTVADDVARAGMGTKALNVLGKAAVPLAVAGSIYEGYTDYTAADQLVESGAINTETGQAFTEADETAGKVEAVTGAAGGLAGGLAGASSGAAMGAAIGSIVPGVGTVIGGAVGGLVGGAAGYFGGSALGSGIGDALTTTSGEAALEAAEDSGLYDKDMLGNSEIDPEILAQTTDTAQLQAIVADDDLSDEDMNMVKARLAELMDAQNSAGDGKVAGVKRGATISSATDDVQLSERGQDAVNSLKGDGVPEVNPETGKRGMVIGGPSRQTGDAVAQATEGAATEGSMQPIINNITNNTGGGSQGPQINTVPITTRPASSTVQRYQDARYGG